MNRALLKEAINSILDESSMYANDVPKVEGYYWCQDGGEPFIVLVRKDTPLTSDHPRHKYLKDNGLPNDPESWSYDVCGSDEGYEPSPNSRWKGPLTP